MLTPVRVSPPSVAPVSVAEAKAHLSIDASDFDTRIAGLIEAATAHVDGASGVLGRCLIDQGWSVSLSGWPCSRVIRLPFPNCSNVVVSYRDQSEVSRTLASTGYNAALEHCSGTVIAIYADTLLPSLSSRPAPITVTFTAGYGAAASDVPASIRQAILLMVGDMFRFTETAVISGSSSVPMSMTVDALLAPHRRVSF